MLAGVRKGQLIHEVKKPSRARCKKCVAAWETLRVVKVELSTTDRPNKQPAFLNCDQKRKLHSKAHSDSRCPITDWISSAHRLDFSSVCSTDVWGKSPSASRLSDVRGNGSLTRMILYWKINLSSFTSVFFGLLNMKSATPKKMKGKKKCHSDYGFPKPPHVSSFTKQALQDFKLVLNHCMNCTPTAAVPNGFMTNYNS